MKESFPKISSLAIFIDAAAAAQQQISDVLNETRLAADGLDIKVLPLEIRARLDVKPSAIMFIDLLRATVGEETF